MKTHRVDGIGFLTRIGVLSVLAFWGCIPLKADNVKRFRLLPPVTVQRPILVDSVDVKGHVIDPLKMMLECPVSLSASCAGAKDVEADSAGVVALPMVHEGFKFYVLTTSIRADRYTSLTLKVKSPSRVVIYVDGEKKSEKHTVQDSVKHAAETFTRLQMEPEVLHNIAVKVLASSEDKCPPSIRVKWDCGKDANACISCAPSLKRRVLLSDINFRNYVSRQSLSPDGRFLLTSYVETFDQSKGNNYTVLSEVRTRRVLATYPQGGGEKRWMPKTSKLWYCVRSAEGMRVLTIDPLTQKEEVLVDNVPQSQGPLMLSPDERCFYTTFGETISADNGPVRRVLSNDDRSGAERSRQFISRYDIATGLNEKLTYGLTGTTPNSVSSDGRYMLYTQSFSRPDVWPFRFTRLMCMDVETRKVDTLVAEDGFISDAHFSPDGKHVVVMGGPASFGGIGKNCGNYPLANDYDKQAYLIDVGTGAVEAISKDFDPSLNFLVWSKYDNCIYFKADDKDRQPVYRYDLKERAFEKLDLVGDCVNSFSVASTSPTVAYTSSTVSSAPAAYLYDIRSHKNTLWADPNARVRKQMEFGEVKDWNFRSSDGTDVTGFYCLPPSFDETKKYPLIVYYYGGTTPTVRSMNSPYSPQLFASRDYVVYVINPSGAIGFGQEFSARHVNAWGDYTADEIIEGVEKFCEEHPFVNADRIGCLGASYGGFMTQYLQTKTKIFRAAVSHAGISNVTSYWGEGYWGVGYNSVAAAQSYPWKDPDLFTRHGSLFNADKITTPLLLLHGTADTNVPIGESIQLFNALKILGRPVEFIEVEGENHFISAYPKQQKWHNSIMAWFARYLQDRPEWWSDLYPERRLK